MIWFHALIDSLSFLSPLVKLVPLSDLISLTWPLLAINRLNAIKKKESVSKMYATSMRTARTAKQVKMTPYLFTRLRPRRTWKGQSIPTDVKGGRSGVWRSTGRSAIFCSQTGPWRRRRRHTWRVLFFRRKWWSKTMYQVLPCSRLFWSGELCVCNP